MPLFSVPPLTDKEFSEILLRDEKIKVERIVSQGHCSPQGFWYDQAEDEWVGLLCGSAVIGFEHFDVFLQKGDHITIKAHMRHRVEATSKLPPCIWLCIFGDFHD